MAMHPLLELTQRCRASMLRLLQLLPDGPAPDGCTPDAGEDLRPGLSPGDSGSEPDVRVHTPVRARLVGAVQGLVQRDYGPPDAERDWEGFMDRTAFDSGDELLSNGLSFTELRLLCRPPSAPLAERLALLGALLGADREAVEREAADAGPHWQSLWRYANEFAGAPPPKKNRPDPPRVDPALDVYEKYWCRDDGRGSGL